MRLTTSEIAVMVAGQLIGDNVAVDGATHDSRHLRPGQLFVPLVAERDGHDFIAAAIAAGAGAYLTAQVPAEPGPVPAIVVDDTLEALARLGRSARDRITGQVVGITGSVGKTTVKDLLRGVLRVDGPVHASPESFNNEIGVPLTLVEAPAGSGRVIVEMGARGLGHIARLCAIARPTVGVVTRAVLAHGEMFGTVDDIARGKSELIQQLPANGLAVLNAGDPRVAAMSRVTSARVLTYGVGQGEVRATQIRVGDDLTVRMRLETPWGNIEVAPAARGRHNAENAAAAAAVGLDMDMSLAAVAEGLATAELSPLRMVMTRSATGARILNDSYNANPTSMRAALDSLSQMPAYRRFAVLGLMAELGPSAADEHEAIAVFAAERGIEVIALDAPQYRASYHGGCDVATIDEAIGELGDLDPHDVVLAKGSRVAGLERLVAHLEAPPVP